MTISEKTVLFNTMLRHAQKEVHDTLAEVYEQGFSGVLLIDLCVSPEDVTNNITHGGRKTAHRLNVELQNKKFSSIQELRKWCGSTSYANAFKGKLHKRIVFSVVANKGCCQLMDDCA